MPKLKRDKPKLESRVGKEARMIHLRVSATEHQWLAEAAKAHGLTLADLLRTALDEWRERREVPSSLDEVLQSLLAEETPADPEPPLAGSTRDSIAPP